jgi:hypothetical protein
MMFPVAIDDRESTVEAYNCDTPEAVLIDQYGSIIWKGRINSNPHCLLVKQQISNLLSE